MMKPRPSVGVASAAPKKSCLSEIQRLQKDREERRRVAEAIKQDRLAEEQRNRENNTPGDIDFMRMIRQWRSDSAPPEHSHLQADHKICICVRKRPISQKEVKRHDYDSVSCYNPAVVIHDCKMKVDGISKYLDNSTFEFDHTFGENNSTDDIYTSAVQPLVEFVLNNGRATVFAYGQTGSGKTYTMQGIQQYVVEDLFAYLHSYEQQLNKEIRVYVSYFEIYGGRCQDLLNSRHRLNVREDGNGEVVVSDLMECHTDSAETLQSIIETGNRNRTTHATESNDESSRSHAICQIALRTPNAKGEEVLLGRLSLIDLAGSERGADTKSHNRQRRMEGAEINKSLLALKECIRALDSNSSHVPYRASKLTLVLKDSFTNKRSKTVMIATVSPAASSADHTINTLRYADRIKEKVVGQAANRGPIVDNSHARVPMEEKPGRAESSSAVPRSANSAEPKHVAARAAPSSYKSEAAHGAKMDHYGGGGYADDEVDATEDAFHETISQVYQEEEDLLNLHMSVIQENAELLTEEGRLLHQIQGENYDIDAYASRLGEILARKQELVAVLREKLDTFRKCLQREEHFSNTLHAKRGY